MSSLNDQLNSFKKSVRNAPVLGKRVVEQPAQSAQHAPPADSPSQSQPQSKRPRVMMYSHAGTAILHAIEYLRKHEVPILLKDLEDYLSSPIEPLLPALQQNPSIRVNMKDRTASYVSRYDIYSGDDLLKFLRKQKQVAFSGLAVKDLRDGWSGALPTINRLEKEQKLLVVRNKKDDSPRTIWVNDGGPVGTIDKMFVELWQAAKVPSSNELPGTLESVGLKPSSVDPSKVKNTASTQNERKQKRARRGKVTNTHLSGVLKHYEV